MKRVTLLFTSANGLWGFVRESKVNYQEVVDEKKTLFCDCGETDIQIAISKYGAVEADKNSNSH